MDIAVDGHQLDLVIADDLAEDVLVLEFRVHPDDREPLVAIMRHDAHPAPNLSIATFADAPLDLVRSIVSSARAQLSANEPHDALGTDDGLVRTDGVEFTQRAARDPERAPGLELTADGSVVASVWWPEEPGAALRARTWSEIDLGAFERFVATAEGELRSP